MSAYTKLKIKQRQFVDEYVICGVATHAFSAANPKLKPFRARQKAWELMQLPQIKAAIQEREEEAMAAAGIRAVQILSRLSEMANLDPAEAQDKDGNVLPLHEMPLHVRRCITAIEVEERTVGKGKQKKSVGRIKRIKFESPMAAQQLLGQHKRLWATRNTVENPDGTPLVISPNADPLDIGRRIAFLLGAGLRAGVPNTPLSHEPEADKGQDESISNSNKQHH